MVALVQAQPLDFADTLPDGAREAIKELLEAEPDATRRVYAALARKVWSLLVERRFDEELRDWHGLLQRVRTRIRHDDAAAAERITALGDLLRESISLAETSPARAVAARPKARKILECLERSSDFLPRRMLMNGLGMGSSHLSNVLTQLVAHNLVDRRDKGKEAEFRLTSLGRRFLHPDTPKATPQVAITKVAVDDLVRLLASQGRHEEAGSLPEWHLVPVLAISQHSANDEDGPAGDYLSRMPRWTRRTSGQYRSLEHGALLSRHDDMLAAG